MDQMTDEELTKMFDMAQDEMYRRGLNPFARIAKRVRDARQDIAKKRKAEASHEA